MTTKKDRYEFHLEKGKFYLKMYRDGVSCMDISYSSSSSRASENVTKSNVQEDTDDVSEDADIFNELSPAQAEDNSAMAGLRKRVERRANMSKIIRKGNEYIFYLAMLPLLGAALALSTIHAEYPAHVKPIHSAIVNTSTVAYNPKLIKVTDMAVLAEKGHKLSYQQQGVFKDDIHWLGQHPNRWYKWLGIEQGGPNGIGPAKLMSPEYYLARVEKTAGIPYTINPKIAVNKDSHGGKELDHIRNDAYHSGMDAFYLNLLLLLGAIGINLSLSRLKKKVDSDDVEKIFPSDDN